MTKQKEKTGILLVAFGTSVIDAHTAYDFIHQRVQAVYPELEVRRAYTSTIVRKKLIERGQDILSPAAALTKMADDGFTCVFVQSLHVIPGYEFHDLLHIVRGVNGLPKGLKQVAVGNPLLTEHDDYVRVSEALHRFSKTFKPDDEALVLMGHGTKHSANICYAGLQEYIRHIDSSIFVGTIEAFPAIEDVIPQLKRKGYKRVWLMPLLTSAGDHVINDMAGEKEGSWKSVLESDSFEVKINRTALGLIDEVVDVWVEKIQL
ncbi:sirohydrochlorin cobaltochelatase [Alkalitalea saponilacus]|uniref:Sirohydrochlorin cobaltochelatase n=1 Tax=Alkalitalea saponilacus TaxID=889453 RepID=A0A1T5GML6_9BACT|nr:sirohydrochlorin cobaltochelatase [Alkalitalea saponilacus]ASB48270.1 sirohydrochlorin cobaltochelatase [Alkalitalea saponilacus]SKC09598.1 sirohydrochlorin cobaltochelatase [Alkalitalea saponilacus]